ncbi:MAG: hypothetical protein HYV28_03400, partial [Ignavibacteriales bacterium]|nr:hypothetical protein [Ignavibacteriales bacterium]
NPPATGSVFGGIQVSGGTVLVDNSLATGRYRTRINVQAAGGDVLPGTYEFLFTSGPTGSPWGNKWAGVTVITDSLQTYLHNTGANNSITLSAGYYSVNFRDAGYTGTDAIFMKTSAVPVTIDSVWGHPSTTVMNNPVTVNVKLNETKSAEERVYLRYSTDNFSTSSAVEITNFDSGTKTGTAIIPGQSSPGTVVKFYVISTTIASSRWGSQNVDLFTLNHKKNGSENFSYEVQPITSIAAGNWSSNATWNTGAVPPSGSIVTINSNVALDADVTLSALTINSGMTFTASDATPRTLTIASNGTLTNNGTFTHGNGTVSFAGNGFITGTIVFNNVISAGGVNFGTAATINGTLTFNAGAWANTNSPFYGTGSTLKYNTGGAYGRYLEWKDTTGAGYPYNVQISNATTLDLGNGGTNVERRIAGNLTIDSASGLTMDSLLNKMTAPLIVGGNVVNNGRLLLSSILGGDLRVAGNFANNNYFTTNGRELALNGSAGQQFSTSPASTTVLDYINIADTMGVTVTSAAGNLLTVNSRLRFSAAKGLFTITGDTLVLGSAATLENEGTDKYVVGNLRTTRSVGTSANTFGGIGVTLAAGTDPGDVTVTRYTGTQGRVTVGSYSGINRRWNISNSGSQSFDARDLSLSWVSNDDNGKLLTKAQVYSGNGSTWTALGAQQDVSATRLATVSVTSLGSFTVSDSASPLVPSLYTLSATALIEGLWNGTTTVQDTLTAELHLATSPYTLVATARAFSSTAGVLSFSFSGIQNGTNYYLVIKHRNSIETWSANPVSFTAYSLSYIFTTAATQAYGSNLALVSGKYCIYSGDPNQDGFVDFSDLTLIDNDSYNFASGYLVTDLNGDLFVDFTDLTICDNNSYNFIGVASPLTSPVKRRNVKQVPVNSITE